MEYNIFEQEAFKNLEPKKLQMLKDFVGRVQGKSSNEVLIEFMGFYKQMSNGKEFSEKERELLISTIYASLPDNDKQKFNSLLKMMRNF